MAKKIQKNLYLPDWLIDMVDAESTKGKSIGVIASAAIYAYCTSPPAVKAKIITAYGEFETSGGAGQEFDEYINEIVEKAVEKKMKEFMAGIQAGQNAAESEKADRVHKNKKRTQPKSA